MDSFRNVHNPGLQGVESGIRVNHHQAILCFCRVVETGSLAAASRALDCSPSAVSKHLRQLEQWTGARLLERTTRALQVTEAGERFYAYCRKQLQETDRMLGELAAQRGQVSGCLTVSAPVSLTLGALGEVLHGFMAAHPAVSLDLRISDEPVDLVREGIDVALRGQAQPRDSSLIAMPVMPIERVLCAAPGYWARRGMPAHPRDLARHDCLVYRRGDDVGLWKFSGADGQHDVAVSGRLRADNSLVLVDAMKRGLGLGVVPRMLVERALRDGSLVAGLGGFRLEPRQLYAVYPSREHLPERVRAFVRYLRESGAQLAAGDNAGPRERTPDGPDKAASAGLAGSEAC